MYFVRLVKKTPTGVARPNEAKTVAEYRSDPAWKEVDKAEYMRYRSQLCFC